MQEIIYQAPFDGSYLLRAILIRAMSLSAVSRMRHADAQSIGHHGRLESPAQWLYYLCGRTVAQSLVFAEGGGRKIMCLAVPMQVMQLDGLDARCAVQGDERQVSLFLLQDELPSIVDWVLILVRYALQVIRAEDAREPWNVLDQLLTKASSRA